MKRRGKGLFGIFLFVFLVLGVIGTIALSSDTTSISEWLAYGRTVDNNKVYPGAVNSNISRNEPNNYTMPASVFTSPTIGNGYLYFGTGTNNSVYQMNYSSYNQTIAIFVAAGNVNNNVAITDDYVYFGGGSYLYQNNASNVSITVSNFTAGGTVSNPIVVNDSVYINAGVNLYQLNASNVSQVLSNDSYAQSLIGSPAYSNGFIYVGEGSTTFLVRQLNASNLSDQIGTHSTSGRLVESPVTVANGRTYVCSSRHMFQANATNVSITADLSYYTHQPSLSISCDAGVTVANGYVYFANAGSGGNKLFQVNESNVSQEIGEYTIGSSVLKNWIVATSDYVFASGGNNILYQFNASNVSNLVGSYSPGDDAVGPTIVDGKLLFSKSTAILYEITNLVNIVSPFDGSVSSDTSLNITYNLGSNIDSCWYSNDSMAVNNTLASCVNITSVTWSEGQHNVTVYVNDTSGNEASGTVGFSIDTTAPVESGASHNLTSLSSGLVYFNITFSDSNPDSYIFSFYNGTDWINDSAVSYTSGTEVSVQKNITITSGTISWYWVVNDSVNNINTVSTSSVSIGANASSSTTTTTSLTGRSSSYIRVLKYGDENRIELRTHIVPGESRIIEIGQEDVGLSELEIKAKNWITGDINVISHDDVPEGCEIDYDGNYNFYKALEVNPSFSSKSIEEARLRVNVLKDWIEDNNIEEIKIVKCNPKYEVLVSSYVSEDEKNGVYDVYSEGFSTFAILGTYEGKQDLRDIFQNSANWEFNYWWIFLVFILFLMIIFFINLRRNGSEIFERIKFDTKWFTFEENFSFKFKSKVKVSKR